jgi:hypothetical protein
MKSHSEQGQKWTYFNFIWTNQTNRIYLLSALGICIIQFEFFKFFYPFPDFFNDSYWYIYAASHHMEISFWPIGYSKFLALFHTLTHSDTALIAFQYFFMQLAALHFFFTILYHFPPKQWVRNAIFIFLFFHPLTLYLANTVASDALFGALTLLWLAELIWTIRRPQLHQLFIQAILFILCFTIRYNAYYYPIVSTIAILASRQGVVQKIAGIVLPILLLITYVSYTRIEAYKSTGYYQFSLLTGWQLGNNALYIYDRIQIDSTQFPTEESREVNRISANFFRESDPTNLRNVLSAFESDYFIIADQSPLKQYYFKKQKELGKTRGVNVWGVVSPAFESFGKSIILHHPIDYTWYFVIPNIRNYLIPSLADIKVYNYGSSHIENVAKNWFDYPQNNIYCKSFTFQNFLSFYRLLFFLLNCYFALQFMLIIFNRKSLQFVRGEYTFYILLAIFLLLNFLFTVVVVINVLRYQYIPIYILFIGGLLMSGKITPSILWRREGYRRSTASQTSN